MRLASANNGGRYGTLNTFYGKKHSEDTKKKISETKIRLGIHKGEKNPFYGKDLSGEKCPAWKGGKSIKIRIICKICGKEGYASPLDIKKGLGKFCSRKCSAIYGMKHMKTKDTSIEIAIENELINRDILYTKQVPILGIALVDFLLPNKVIIQADGNYWHSEKINKGRDIKQDTILCSNGYNVFRFSETEINKSASKCIDKIMGEVR